MLTDIVLGLQFPMNNLSCSFTFWFKNTILSLNLNKMIISRYPEEYNETFGQEFKSFLKKRMRCEVPAEYLTCSMVNVTCVMWDNDRSLVSSKRRRYSVKFGFQHPLKNIVLSFVNLKLLKPSKIIYNKT